MRAVWLNEVGPPDRLTPGDAPEPALAPGHALVDVAFANVTFVETQLRAGRGPFQLDLPTIPGNGVGGVVAAAGGERKLALTRELGADAAVDYTQPDWPPAAGPVDVVFDSVGGAIARAAFGLLRPGGRMLSYGLASGSWSDVTDAEAQERGVSLRRPQRPDPAQQRGDTATALAEAAAGRLRPVIGQRVPLTEAARAHAAIEARETIGKTLLVI